MNAPRSSIVAERFEGFLGRIVAVRLTWNEAQSIVGRLAGVRPVGRDYFIELIVDGRPRMLSTRAVLEIAVAA